MTRVNFLIGKINDKTITFRHVRTEDNEADILTKLLALRNVKVLVD